MCEWVWGPALLLSAPEGRVHAVCPFSGVHECMDWSAVLPRPFFCLQHFQMTFNGGHAESAAAQVAAVLRLHTNDVTPC